MLCDKNESLESRNFVDGVDFTANDPCIFVVYPAGASGDLLISIIDKHFLRTGCEYYGIDHRGKVHLYSSDYEIIDIAKTNGVLKFDSQWFYNFADKLASRNLNYSLLDQVIFGSHLYKDHQIKLILDTFPKCKIIRILPKDSEGEGILNFLAKYKLQEKIPDFDATSLQPEPHVPYTPTVTDNRIIDIPFACLFSKNNYYKYYDILIDFLNLNGRLICYDYVKYYISKQHPEIRDILTQYSKKI